MARKKNEEQQNEPELSPREKALKLTLASIEKDFGKEAIIIGDEKLPGIQWFSSGCMSLNKALTGEYDKGYPRGRTIEIYGPESSGKTTLCLHAIAEIQKLDERAAFIDVEHAFDPIYATTLGVDTGTLIFSQPENGEQALQIADRLIKSGALGLVVIDSVAALTPQAELEGEIGDSHMGRQARLMSQAMRMLAGPCQRTNTTMMFVNQIRMKIGVMFGSPETTAGGNALKFYSSQRLDIRRTGGVSEGSKEDKEVVANTTKVKVVKNKVACPFRQAEFQIRYGYGIDIIQDLLKVAVDNNIVEKSGAWYSFNGNRLGQGEANVVAALKEQPDLIKEIQSKL
jgi:recombination protein RecA